MSQAENRLNEECNLVIAGTHEVYVRDGDFAVFVVDKELPYSFRVPMAMTQAIETANESKESSDGCSTCPLKEVCNPDPVALKKDSEMILIPALKTSFIGFDARQDGE